MDEIAPAVLSNWKRLVLFFIFWFLGCVLFYMPVYILYSDFFEGSKANFKSHYNNHPFLLLSQLGMVGGVAFAIYITIIKIEKKKIRDIGLTFNTRHLWRGFVVSFLLMSFFAIVVRSFHLVEFDLLSISSNVLFGIPIYLLVSVGEEVFVRGYVLNNMREKFNDNYSILLSSVLFAAMHLFNDYISWIGFVNIFLSGIVMGIVFVKSKTISAPIGFHFAWNFFQGPVYGFNVSGNLEEGILKMTPLSSGILTGGNFGAEGSLVLIPIVLLTIYLVWKYF